LSVLIYGANKTGNDSEKDDVHRFKESEGLVEKDCKYKFEKCKSLITTCFEILSLHVGTVIEGSNSQHLLWVSIDAPLILQVS